MISSGEICVHSDTPELIDRESIACSIRTVKFQSHEPSKSKRPGYVLVDTLHSSNICLPPEDLTNLIENLW